MARPAVDDVMRACVIAAVATAPLVFGAIDPRAYVPLLAVAYVTGLASWIRAVGARGGGRAVPRLPGAWVLLALHALVLLQLVPLPPRWLLLISPGSYALYYIPPPVDLPAPWRPISVSPNDTLRGLAFLAAMSLLYATVFRELREERWRRRLCAALAGTGLILTVVALVQAASPEPTRIYGLFRPRLDWAVFGPYVNRNHFAGYMAMVVPLGFAFAAEAVRDAAERFRRLGLWRALGEREVSALGRRAAVAIVLLVGLLASQSRGGIVAGAVSLAVFLLMFRRRWQAFAFVALLLLVGLLTVDLSAMQRGFETRGFNRLELWRDMLQLVPQFPSARRRPQRLRAGLSALPDGRTLRPLERGPQRLSAGPLRHRHSRGGTGPTASAQAGPGCGPAGRARGADRRHRRRGDGRGRARARRLQLADPGQRCGLRGAGGTDDAGAPLAALRDAPRDPRQAANQACGFRGLE